MTTCDTMAIAKALEDTVNDYAVKMRAFDEAVVTHRPSPDRWTIKEVVGHLVDSATNNHQRFVRAQKAALTFPKYEQRFWVETQDYDNCDWQTLLEFWKLYNVHLAHVIRRIRPDKLEIPCDIGPYDTVTLEFLVVDYLDHLKFHLQKIDERLS